MSISNKTLNGKPIAMNEPPMGQFQAPVKPAPPPEAVAKNTGASFAKNLLLFLAVSGLAYSLSTPEKEPTTRLSFSTADAYYHQFTENQGVVSVFSHHQHNEHTERIAQEMGNCEDFDGSLLREDKFHDRIHEDIGRGNNDAWHWHLVYNDSTKEKAQSCIKEAHRKAHAQPTKAKKHQHR